MKDKKPFFYRIDAATFLLEVVTTPEEERGKKFYQLALDMVSGKGTFPYSKQIIAEVKQFKEKKSAAGQKGMKNRWLRDNSDITNDNTVITKDDSVITRSSTEAVAETEAVTIQNHKQNHNLINDAFEDFWQAYPKKVGKGDARKSWQKIKPCDQLQQRMAMSLESQKQSVQWLKDGGKFIPNPSTWLNQQRWEDDLTPLPYKSEQELRREQRMQELF